MSSDKDVGGMEGLVQGGSQVEVFESSTSSIWHLDTGWIRRIKQTLCDVVFVVICRLP